MNILENKKKNGFSLVEVLVAISLNLLVVTMIITVVSMSLRHIQTIRDNRELYSAASFLNNQLDYWIKRGSFIVVVDGSALEIHLPDYSVKTIAKNGDSLTIDGVSLTNGNVGVADLAFVKMDRSVRVSFTLDVKGSNQSFSATTTVAQRNAF